MFDLFKQIWSNRREAAPVESLGDQRMEVGSAKFPIPQGWRVNKRNDEICILRSADNLQQATISLMRFKSSPDFDAFKALCDKRVPAEKQDLGDGFIEAQAPATSRGVFNMSSSAQIRRTAAFSRAALCSRKQSFTRFISRAPALLRNSIWILLLLLYRDSKPSKTYGWRLVGAFKMSWILSSLLNNYAG